MLIFVPPLVNEDDLVGVKEKLLINQKLQIANINLNFAP